MSGTESVASNDTRQYVMRARTGVVVGSAADGGNIAVTSSVNVHTIVRV